MREVLEIQVPMDWAEDHFDCALGEAAFDDSGLPVEDWRLTVDSRDPIVEQIRSALLAEEEAGLSIVDVSVDRQYADDEIEAAEALRLRFDGGLIKTWGERCGTQYERHSGCAVCGWGVVQTSALFLDIQQIPQDADFAFTVAQDEWVVSARVASLLAMKEISGCRLAPIIDSTTKMATQGWYQLSITGHAGACVHPTRFGVDFFHPDGGDQYRCAPHAWRGPQLLSEIYLSPCGRAMPDIAITRDRFGQFLPYIRPTPAIVISNRFAQLLRSQDFRGYRLEIVHIRRTR